MCNAHYMSIIDMQTAIIKPNVTAGGFIATFKGRIVTTQFDCAHFNVDLNMLVCVVSRYIVWCVIYFSHYLFFNCIEADHAIAYMNELPMFVCICVVCVLKSLLTYFSLIYYSYLLLYLL